MRSHLTLGKGKPPEGQNKEKLSVPHFDGKSEFMHWILKTKIGFQANGL